MEISTGIHFLHQYIFVYLWMVFTTFLNVLAPLSGSTIVNPVTAYFTDIPRAIAIGSLTFALSGMHRVWLFRRNIFEEKENRKIIKLLLPFSIVGAALGGLIIAKINQKLLAAIVILVSLYFVVSLAVRLVGVKKKEKEVKITSLTFVALFSGFFQGSGMPGSDIRNNYLRRHIKETSIRGVGSVIGVVNFAIGGSILALHNHLLKTDVVFIMTLFPMLMTAQHYGKKVLEKIKDSHAKVLAILLSLLGIFLLLNKYFI